MAAFVDVTTGFDGSANTVVATASNTFAAGNLAVGGFASQEWASQTYTFNDGTTEFTAAVASAGGAGISVLRYLPNTGAGGKVLTVTASANERYKHLNLIEISGCDTSTPLDDSDSAEASGATDVTTPSMTASTSGIIVYCCTSTNDRTWTPGTGFTEINDGAGGNSYESGYQVIATSGSYTASATASAASNLSIAAAIFKDAAGGGASYNAAPVLEYYQSLKRGGVFH